ncbi:MAG: PKD domain-containing protein [Candidatus Aminicenantes bacterium]|nr:PKD domain-containing protein [Candidatus Aminicenantes bacterium]
MKNKNSLFRRGLVCGIILLLIGLSVTSSISGYIGKMSNQSTNDDDYVNAYWEFDEGSGNTAYDSSGHDYDGTIYGATWTTGHSGYALDYNGVSDYVGLDAHSENLGFNKTDDVIFSVYFKTTSTDPGCIYSMSHHWVGNYPETHIELNSNGTIKVQVWVGSCGLSLTSEDTYNDDSWHHAEIFYNGITANPTVEIYVDSELDTSITQWVCSFSNDEFERAKIGRQSRDAIEYFDGVIDKLKIIKYPGGNDQNSPIISGPTDGEPGVEYDFTFVTEDPEGDDIWLYIDWDDGTVEDWIGPYASGEEVIVSHEWDDDGRYEITARSKDIWDHSSWSVPYPVRIGNQAPDAPEITGPQFGDVGVEYEYAFVANDFEENDIYYYVDWGDGTHDDWFGPYPSGEEATATHAWDLGGDYHITAKAKDTHDVEGEWSVPYPVRIGNQAPDAPAITGEINGEVDVEYEYTFNATDPEGDDVYYEIEWGDGTNITDLGPYESGEEVVVNHTWSAKGTYTIKAKAKDIYGAESDWSTLEVTMPKNKPFNFNFPLISWLLERFPNAFPILRHMLGL